MHCLTKNRRLLSVLMVAVMVISLTPILPVSGALAAIEDPPVYPPDQEGPYDVGWYTVQYDVEPYGTYRAYICYPAKRDGWKTRKDMSGKPYSGIVVSNGYYGSNWNITWIPKHLASHGYITIAFTPPEGGTLNTWTIAGLLQSFDQTQWAEGFNAGIDELKQQNKKLFSPIYGLLDTDKFGVIGLSMGGAGAIEAAASNPEIDTVVGLAPGYLEGIPGMDNCDVPDWMMENLACVMGDLIDAVDEVTVPVQIQVGTNDGFVKYEWIYKFYNELIINASTKEYVEINGASHAAFLDLWVAPIGDKIEQMLGNANVCGFEEQQQISSRYFTSWFQYHLNGMNEYETYLFGVDAETDLNCGILTKLEYDLQTCGEEDFGLSPE